MDAGAARTVETKVEGIYVHKYVFLCEHPSFVYQNLDFQKGPSGDASPLRTTVCRLPGRGLFFPRITRPWNFRPHLGDFLIFVIQKRRGVSPEVGSTNFQPVMFDMDPFDGKKVPYTKYQ